MNPNDPNVVMLELVARRLGTQLCEQFAFVGGAAAGGIIAVILANIVAVFLMRMIGKNLEA